VVRDTVPLDLKSGVNQVQFGGATAHLEPSSVVLRDPAGKHPFQVLEQNYRGDPVSQEMLLTLNEGKTIDFEVVSSENGKIRRELIRGKIIRGGSPLQPIIEVDGNCALASQGSRFSPRWPITPF
jgi:hypothetical protein